MTVYTNHYLGITGKQPKGFGNWAFEIAGNTYFFIGMYSAAKKEAIAMAKAIDVYYIDLV
jgi:hypothetical protein